MAALEQSITGIALTTPRIAAAFLMLPLITQSNMPALVRNSFFVSLAIVSFPIAAATGVVVEASDVAWQVILIKEAFIGVSLGFAFGMIFWAIGAAGNMIDAKVGSFIGTVMDPVQGHQTSLLGAFLSQFAAWLFMASGAFLVFLDLLMTSYAVWPVASYLPSLKPAMAVFYGKQFGFLMTTALLLAAPAIVVMMLVDVCMGLINRFAQQLQVFIYALPIKAWLAIWVLFLTLGVLVEVLLRKIAELSELLKTLQVLF